MPKLVRQLPANAPLCSGLPLPESLIAREASRAWAIPPRLTSDTHTAFQRPAKATGFSFQIHPLLRQLILQLLLPTVPGGHSQPRIVLMRLWGPSRSRRWRAARCTLTPFLVASLSVLVPLSRGSHPSRRRIQCIGTATATARVLLVTAVRAQGRQREDGTELLQEQDLGLAFKEKREIPCG